MDIWYGTGRLVNCDNRQHTIGFAMGWRPLIDLRSDTSKRRRRIQTALKLVMKPIEQCRMSSHNSGPCAY